jgi:putative YhdH/YhfP family quinone oxidoreductase
MEHFKALWTVEQEDGSFDTSLQELSTDILGSHEVLVQVVYSSLNYKDALSAHGHRGITQQFPHIPGIDAAGIILNDPIGQFQSGDQVIVTGFDLGMNTHGGLSELIRVPASWIVPLPTNLSLKRSMQLGTAGLTAGMAVLALQQNQIFPESGEIFVTGASGGVGMCAIKLLHHLGYQVVALSGKPDLTETLMTIGASRVIDRNEFMAEKPRTLYPMTFAGGIDTVGGDVLVKLMKSLKLAGSVAVCGMACGVDLPLQVYPFILRGARMLGIYSADSPWEKKKEIWQLYANEWNYELDSITETISLAEAPDKLNRMVEGLSHGRYVVQILD